MKTNAHPPVQTWTHKGITITFESPYATFLYNLDGKPKRSASLDAAKAAIDKAKLNTFTPFDAFVEDTEGLVGVRVVAFQKAERGNRYSHDNFKVECRDGEVKPRRFTGNEHTVFVETEENRLRFRLAEEASRAHHAAEDATKKMVAAFQQQVTLYTASDFAGKGKLEPRVYRGDYDGKGANIDQLREARIVCCEALVELLDLAIPGDAVRRTVIAALTLGAADAD